MSQSLVTRFAPSPTGFLHKGHALSAMLAHRRARQANGLFRLRIEDIDSTRCRPAYGDAIIEDLTWLGLIWDGPVERQSDHPDRFAHALARLRERDVVYPCFCTRKTIQQEVERSVRAPHGPEGPLYPGTCRALDPASRAACLAEGHPHAWRLDVRRALNSLNAPLPPWHDELHGSQPARPDLLGDVVVARKDIATSYHLAVVVDDAAQNVTHVVRGEDLWHATHVHVLLQALLGLPQPVYHHHGLMTDAAGRRFAKRDRSATLKALREAGTDPAALLADLAASPVARQSGNVPPEGVPSGDVPSGDVPSEGAPSGGVGRA
ncbi:tRNA glutamyl-Q(34) synthetase GluQRS [Yunchengibacter salinarum]|uniref:tRNA glutamyl-Q(34) synthetase GluQRS n=1 Tax=Yunchengibacter salinarum TaxID=3133399 RepID=UPI0035B5C049